MIKDLACFGNDPVDACGQCDSRHVSSVRAGSGELSNLPVQPTCCRTCRKSPRRLGL